MILRQIYLPCLSQASYLLGDERTGTALVVDPRRDVEVYLEEAAALGLRIRHAVLTHFHADFAAGHLELQERTGCRLHMGRRAQAEFDFEPAADGDRWILGDLEIEVLETPGHTPESLCLLAGERIRGAFRPQALLSGDTLFLGSVGRPDLLASAGASAEELAGWLYDSLQQRILPLPDELELLPGHGPGSFCGASLGQETRGRLGEEKRTNPWLQPMSREEFVRRLVAGLPPQPAYFSWDAAFNRRRHPLLEESLAASLRPLSLDALLEGAAAGLRVLDVRSPEDFARGHLPGSWNVGLDGRFAPWAGAILAPDEELAVVAPPGREREALLRLGRVGFDRAAGFLEGGAETLASRPGLLRRIRRWRPEELGPGGPPGPGRLLDVREDGERAAGAIPGSEALPLSRLRAGLEEARAAVRGGALLYCRSGYRSMIAASMLAAGEEAAEIGDLAGGYLAWAESFRPSGPVSGA